MTVYVENKCMDGPTEQMACNSCVSLPTETRPASCRTRLATLAFTGKLQTRNGARLINGVSPNLSELQVCKTTINNTFAITVHGTQLSLFRP